MDGNLTWLIAAGIINIFCIVREAYGKASLKPLVILSGIAVVWFGFQWQSWLGAIGSYVGILVIVGVLRSTVLKRSLDQQQGAK